MATLRLLHRAIGIALAIPIAAVALSGALLVFKQPYYRARFPSLGSPAVSDLAHQARILQRIEVVFRPASVRVVKFPRDGFNAFHIYLSDGSEALVDGQSGTMLTRWDRGSSAAAFLFDLHAHLLTGRAGETVNGILAVGLVFFAVTGVVLWWPGRRGYGVRQFWPRRLAPAALVRSHAAMGFAAALPIVIFGATGAALVFYEPIRAVSSALFDQREPEEPAAVVAPGSGPRRPFAEILENVHHVFGASPAMYYPGSGGNAALTFRLRLPGELHPNGRSYVLVDPSSARVVQAIDARAQGVGTRAMHAVYPIHAATVGGFAWRAVAVASGVSLAILTFIGVSAWGARRVVARRRASGQPAHPRHPAHPGQHPRHPGQHPRHPRHPGHLRNPIISRPRPFR